MLLFVSYLPNPCESRGREGLNKYFTKDDIQEVNKHITIPQLHFHITQIQIKASMADSCAPRWAGLLSLPRLVRLCTAWSCSEAVAQTL
jgi:hypothetical protein